MLISVISGGSSGLGYSLAWKLLGEGKNVIILGRNKNKLAEAEKRLKEIKGTGSLHSLVCNIGNEVDIRKAGDFIKKNQMTVEYLFNNAGMGLFNLAERRKQFIVLPSGEPEVIQKRSGQN
jgi:short-subunit dehydrogenase